VGEWIAGKAHGQGIETRPDGSIRHDGRWENDQPLREFTASTIGDGGMAREPLAKRCC
jgi:MORN repeat